MEEPCFICQKHAGIVAPPPGGYLYQNAHWKVCHAPATLARLGTLFVESKRHVLDFADMTTAETTTYGQTMTLVYAALKRLLNAERVYTVMMLEGVPHCHVWLVPRLPGETLRGVELLAQLQTMSCLDAEAVALAEPLRGAIAQLDGQGNGLEPNSPPGINWDKPNVLGHHAG